MLDMFRQCPHDTEDHMTHTETFNKSSFSAASSMKHLLHSCNAQRADALLSHTESITDRSTKGSIGLASRGYWTQLLISSMIFNIHA